MTTIAGRDVPIEEGEVITLDFTGGPNAGDEGPKDFWFISNGKYGYPLRWHHGQDPGERFRMMEGARGYEREWDIARTAIGIRPANKQEVIDWLKKHPKDVPFVQSGRIDGKMFRVVPENSGYRLEDIDRP
jgi:hypothetical protein